MVKPGDYIGPLGNVITGSIHDCNKERLERALQFYDRQLYIKWNPKKRGGHGVWEVRRRPDYPSAIYQGSFQGQSIYTVEPKENDLINHVLDVPILHDNVLGRIKEMDAWRVKDYVSQMDDAAVRHRDTQRAKAREEMRYNIKQFKREWRDFADLVSSGVNPSAVLKGIRG